MDYFFSTSKYKFVLLLLAVNSSISSTSAGAETKPPRVKYQVQSQQVELPDIPKYTGRSVYVGAKEYSGSDVSGKVLRVTYLMQEDPDMVTNWYSGALKSYQWSIQDNKDDPKRLHGSKGKATCSVFATAYNGPVYRTALSITYRPGE
jgi:hypothetical protein